jgi:NitT/TauT family transport system substrate-binding protein
MKRFEKITWYFLVGLLWVTLLIVPACSIGAATPTPTPLEPVTLQLQWITQAQFAGYYVALDKGWYREEGIDLTIKPGGPDISPSDAVATGTADFGTGLLADIIVAIQAGKPLVSIGQIQQMNGLLLVAKKSSGIEQPQDFVGKRVGVWLGSWETQFEALVAREKIAPQDFELVSQGFSMDPFLDGSLDVASVMIYNEYHVLLENGVKPDELNLIDYADYGLDFPGDTLFTNRQVAEQRPDLSLGMLRASLRGWQYAIDHPEETVDIILKYDETGMQTKGHQLSMMDEIAKLIQVTVRPLGYTDRADVRRTIETLLNYGVLDRRMQPEDVYMSQFWDQIQSETQ